MIKHFFLLLLLVFGSPLFAMEFTTIGELGNFFFDIKDKEAIGGGTFNGTYTPSGKIEISDSLGDTFRFTVALARDSVLRNSFGGEVEIGTTNFIFSVGPFLGLFNSSDYLKPGISGSMQLVFPGVVFVRIGAAATLPGVSGTGDYETLSTGAAVGFWLPNLVNTISFTTKKFSIQETRDRYTEDALYRAQYRGAVHSKSNAYIVAITTGFQMLKRRYENTSSADTDEMRSFFMGFDTEIVIKPLFTLLLGVEAPLYSWGNAPLERKDGAMFFSASAGFRYVFAD
ncbi:MAG: hypothetical protein LBJ31_06920 [Treponema sp.]|jgi:hypothetical protein|nr:hypothetical protein [Treponema sp.]